VHARALPRRHLSLVPARKDAIELRESQEIKRSDRWAWSLLRFSLVLPSWGPPSLCHRRPLGVRTSEHEKSCVRASICVLATCVEHEHAVLWIADKQSPHVRAKKRNRTSSRADAEASSSNRVYHVLPRIGILVRCMTEIVLAMCTRVMPKCCQVNTVLSNWEAEIFFVT
jgi:hypothetical protein